MSMNKEAQQLMDEYSRWAETRRFFAPPDQRNVLSQFMPSKTGKEPNGPMSAEMQAFHISLVGTPHYRRASFVAVYSRDCPWPAKKVADELNMSRATLYRLAHKTAAELVTRTKVTVSLIETKQVGHMCLNNL